MERDVRQLVATVVRALLAPLLCVMAVSSVGVAPAAAHAQLEGSEPPSGSALAESPPFFELRFDEPVEIALGAIELVSADGTSIDVGAADHPGGDRRRVSVPLPELGDGTYVASWRVVSSDGHPVQGAVTFAVGAARPVVDDAVLGDFLAAQESGGLVDALGTLARTFAYGGVLVLVGAVALALVGWRAGLDTAAGHRIAVGAWTAAVVGAVAQFAVQGPTVLGTGVGDAFRPGLWSDIAATQVGRALLIRIVVLAIAWFVLSRYRGGMHSPIVWALVSVALAVATASSGHAAAGDGVAAALASASLHLLVAAVWVGGLVYLLAVVVRLAPDDDAITAINRFSTIALVAVLVVSATGTVQALRQVGSVDGLVSTTYGRLLCTKLVLVAVMVVVASWSRAAVRAHRLAPATVTVGGDRVDDLDAAGSTSVLRMNLMRTVGAEVAIAVAVVATTALLVDQVPAKDDLARPVEATVLQSGVALEVVVLPGRVGLNEVHLYLARVDGGLGDPTGATVRLVDVDDPENPISVPVRPDGPGHFRADELIVPTTGTWRLEVVASDDASSRRFATEFDIRG
jgi:copper transport protein